jgi:hypothetical protein
MEESVAACIYKIAPREKPSKWSQQALKRVLNNWQRTRRSDFESILESPHFDWIVGFHITPSELGQYGYDTGLHFVQDSTPELPDDIETEHLVEPFFDEWIDQIQQVIKEDQEQTMFSPKEYAVFLANRHPMWNEHRMADALEITVGTYRGKVGRVKDKLEVARNTVELSDELPDDSSVDSWARGSHSCPLRVLYRVDESRLPVSAPWGIEGSDLTLEDLPLDRIIRD